MNAAPQGPDLKVCRYLVQLLGRDIVFVPIAMDNKPNLIENCGKVAKVLLDECEKVVVVWDLYPPWRERGVKPCRHQDRERIFNSLKEEGVDLNRISLVCICEELEAWLLADHRAVRDMIAELKRPHPVGKNLQIQKAGQNSQTQNKAYQNI